MFHCQNLVPVLAGLEYKRYCLAIAPLAVASLEPYRLCVILMLFPPGCDVTDCLPPALFAAAAVASFSLTI